MKRLSYQKLGDLTLAYAKKRPISSKDRTSKQNLERGRRHAEGLRVFVPKFKNVFFAKIKNMPAEDKKTIQKCISILEKELYNYHLSSAGTPTLPVFELNPNIQQILLKRNKEELSHLQKNIQSEIEELDQIVNDHVYGPGGSVGGWSHYYGKSAFVLYTYLTRLNSEIIAALKQKRGTLK